MFKYLSKLKIMKHFTTQVANGLSPEARKAEKKLLPELKQNLSAIKEVFGASNDIVIREFEFGMQNKVQAAIIFVEGMIEKSIVDENILRPLMCYSGPDCLKNLADPHNIETLMKRAITIREAKTVSNVQDTISGVLSGDTVLLIDGSSDALVLSTKGWEARGVQEPNTETVVRGPREGFTETLRTNTAMLRRKIQNPNLIIETMQLGERTKTSIVIAYIKGITNPRLIKEIKLRFKKIQIDSILESGYIEQLIEDAPFSPFATIGNSEKPDKVAAKILEGRAVILVDGTPMVLTMPMVFIENFQSSEDYYSRPYYASLIRVIRFIAFFISILAPASYVALSTYHQEIIPTSLLITMAAAIEGTPFPAVIEVISMGIVFEILREAGVRLPRPVGQAVSIVGALVIGEVAVSAGLVGAPVLIVIAITAIASFTIPSLTDASAIIRIILILLASVLGAFGIVMGLLGVLIHLSSIKSFGVPYLSPFAPLNVHGLKDTLIRAPLWMMLIRPRAIGWHDQQRQDFNLLAESDSKAKNQE